MAFGNGLWPLIEVWINLMKIERKLLLSFKFGGRKSLTALILFLIISLSFNLFAYGNELDRSTSDDVIVDVTDSGVSLDKEIPESNLTEKNGTVEIQVGKSLYLVNEPNSGSEDRTEFEALPEASRQRFSKNRLVFLKTVARALHLTKYGFGIGTIVKDKIKFVIQSVRPSKKNQIADANEDVGSRDLFTEQEVARSTLKERSNEVIQNVLASLDRKLWQQAALFSNSNEFGVMAAGGLELIAGKRDKGWGGLLDFGISIGFNIETRSLVIQIFSDYERYRSSLMPAVFIAGLVGKSGLYIASLKTGELSHQGTSFYPPMVPGFSSSTPKVFMSGLSSGLTWPPSPIGDALTYTNTLDQAVLLRLTISPMTKGFVRIQSGLGSAIARIVIQPVNSALAKFRAHHLNKCAALFSSH